MINLAAQNAAQAMILQTDVVNETTVDRLVTQVGEGLATDQEAPHQG